MKHPEAKAPTTPAPPKKRRRKADKRGVALVMTLGAITVLTVFLTELQEDTSAELSSALSERDALRAEYYARSAVNLARLLIGAEPDIRKPMSLFVKTQIPVWEFTDMVLGPFNDSTGAQAFTSLINADTASAKNIGLTGGGHFELKIVDEDSKINVNNAAHGVPDETAKLLLPLISQPAYNPLFEGRDVDNQFSDRPTVCGALVDWADADEDLYGCDPFSSTAPSSKGAEDNFYQMIGLGYRRKNAPFDSLEELRLVRGMSDDFWSTFVDPEPSDPRKRVMTVWGEPKTPGSSSQVNINTANATTILALICSDKGATDFCNDPVQVAGFLSAMSLVRIMTQGIPLIQRPSDFVNAFKTAPDPSKPTGNILAGILASSGIKLPIIFKDAGGLAKRMSLESKVFSIYADGVVPGYRKSTKVRIHAVMSIQGAQPIGSPIPVGDNTSTDYERRVKAYPGGHIFYWRVE